MMRANGARGTFSVVSHMAILHSRCARTELLNRRGMLTRLESELQRSEREGGRLGILWLDVDHFKKFNDGYGHQAGDDTLRLIAVTLKSALRRPADLVARYGGEEFSVILPNCLTAFGETVAERIRLAVQGLSGLHRPVTVSLGGAMSDANTSPVVMVERADASTESVTTQVRTLIGNVAPYGFGSVDYPNYVVSTGITPSFDTFATAVPVRHMS